MLTNGALRFAAMAAAVLALFTAMACSAGDAERSLRQGGSDEPPGDVAQVSETAAGDEAAGQEVPRRVTIGFAHWGDGLSLQRMVENPTVIVVGRVTGADVGRVKSLIIHDAVGEPPPGHPKANAPTPDPNDPHVGIPWTNYTVEIVRPVRAPGFEPGQLVTVSQEGGLIDGVAYEMEGDRVILVGTSYLFFLYEARAGIFVVSPFMRLEIDADGRLRPIDPAWSKAPVVAQLAGLTVDEAAATIEAAIAQVR